MSVSDKEKTYACEDDNIVAVTPDGSAVQKLCIRPVSWQEASRTTACGADHGYSPFLRFLSSCLIDRTCEILVSPQVDVLEEGCHILSRPTIQGGWDSVT